MRNIPAACALLSLIVSSPLPAVAGEPAATAEETTPLPSGSPLPQLKLTTAEGEPFDLNAAVAEKPTILILYRGGW